MRSLPATGPSIEESTPGDYSLPHPAPGAPNVVLIVLDDLGFGQLGCFGSGISTPAMDGLAANGLRYNHFHVTSLCSPTRACVMTGRNHHAVGMGFLTDLPMAFPGYTGRVPKSAAPLPRVLRDEGYNTLAVGKWHLVPAGERSSAGPFDRWPLGFGFERYYGFLQGDTNHWAPHLVEDNHYVEQPAAADGRSYHLTEDLADRAIRSVTAQHEAAPDRPFFLYFALGAMHAPHHVAPEWIEPYTGAFDGGWDHWRDEVFARQLATGVVPAGTELSVRPGWIDEWSSLSADARRMLARQQEVFAGFLSHTDAQIGRLLTQLERLGVLDDTLVMLISDNGASGEGGALGTFNEHRFTEHVPDTVEGNLAWSDELGGIRSYPHYSWGWAWAGNTPLRLWKRYTWLGGTRTPLIVHWPRGFAARGEVRDQFVHAVDLMPTVLDVAGIDAPTVVDGVTQQPFDGASIRATFTDASAPSPRSVQYFEMLGSRSIVVDGWKATTDHVSKGVVDEERLMDGSRDVRRRRVGAVPPPRRLLREPRRGRRPSRRGARRCRSGGRRKQAATRCSRSSTSSSGESPRSCPGPTRCRPAPCTGPRAARSPTTRWPGCSAASGWRPRSTCPTPTRPASSPRWAIGPAASRSSCATGASCSCSTAPATRVASRVTSTYRPVGTSSRACTRPASPDPVSACIHDDELIAHAVLPVTAPLVFQHGGTMLTLGRDRGLPVAADYDPPFAWNGVLHQLVIETGPAIAPSIAEAARALLHSE